MKLIEGETITTILEGQMEGQNGIYTRRMSFGL
jgi:hypothetical protein